MDGHKLLYNGIRGGNNTYIGPRLMVLHKTLINPNKCQAFGIQICYNPTNQNMPLEIEADFNTHIPMLMVGCTCGFITRYRIYYKIETC